MNRLVLLCLTLLVVSSTLSAQTKARQKAIEPNDALGVTLKNDFSLGWIQAYQIVRNFEDRFTKAARTCAIKGIDGSFLASIIYPELLRYSLLRDRLEIAALQMFYVKFGEDQANFSVGPFQMKPGFARLIELELASFDKLPSMLQALLRFSKNDELSMRSERIVRLSSIEWQILYLSAFCIVINAKFDSWLEGKTTVEKLSFFAAAYNGGFHRPAEVIERIASRSDFSKEAEKKAGAKSYAYHTISVWAYEKLFPYNGLFAK